MYPIADMLNRIRNAQAVQKETVEVPFSNMNLEIAKILEKNDFVGKAEKKGKKMKKIIEIDLKYDGKAPAVSGLKIVSRPGQRIYVQSKNIKIVRGGYGISIVSTSKGLMTNKEAKKKKVGGELICEIW